MIRDVATPRGLPAVAEGGADATPRTQTRAERRAERVYLSKLMKQHRHAGAPAAGAAAAGGGGEGGGGGGGGGRGAFRTSKPVKAVRRMFRNLYYQFMPPPLPPERDRGRSERRSERDSTRGTPRTPRSGDERV